MDYYSKYLKYKQKYLDLQNQIGGKGWRSGLEEDEINRILAATKKLDKDERKKVRNQMAAEINTRKKEQKRAEKAEAQRAAQGALPKQSRSHSERESKTPIFVSDEQKTIDFLRILGLTLETANKDSIKRAYFKGALKYHPDKSDSASESSEYLANQEKFKELSNAHDYLKELPQYQ